MDLQPPLASSPALVHLIDLLPLSQEPGVFYMDEIVIADTNLTGDLRIPPLPWDCPSNGNLKLLCQGLLFF